MYMLCWLFLPNLTCWQLTNTTSIFYTFNHEIIMFPFFYISTFHITLIQSSNSFFVAVQKRKIRLIREYVLMRNNVYIFSVCRGNCKATIQILQSAENLNNLQNKSSIRDQRLFRTSNSTLKRPQYHQLQFKVIPT